MSKKDAFVVKLKIPAGVNKKEMKAYIKEAVRTWKGQLPPYDPLFHLSWTSVSVTTLEEHEAYIDDQLCKDM